MRYIVITENPMTGERTTVETKDFESLRIDNPKSLPSLTSQTSKRLMTGKRGAVTKKYITLNSKNHYVTN